MRLFWALIGVLVLATAGLFVAKGAGEGDRPRPDEIAPSPPAVRPSASNAASDEPTTEEPAAAPARTTPPPNQSPTNRDIVDEPEAGPEAVEAERIADTIPGEVDIVPAAPILTPEEAADIPAAGPEAVAPGEPVADKIPGEVEITGNTPDPAGETAVQEPPADVPENEPVAHAPDESADPDDAIPSIDEILDVEPDETAEAPDETPSDEPAGLTGDPLAGLDFGQAETDERAAEATPATPDAPPAPSTIVERDDGTLLVNDRYVVRGEGTRAEPYEIGIDLLVSVQDDYNPRTGKDVLPAWLARFEGRWVRISGNMLFPLWADETDELLLMKNQWDGCCIGVPPTPYDAVEVKLDKAVDLSRVGEPYGPVEGRFKVEPYIRSKWLLGLYVMEDAHLAGG